MTFAHLLPFITFGLGMLAQLLLSGWKAAESALTDHISDLSNLRSIAVDYWLEKGGDDAESEHIHAARVQVALAVVMEFYSVSEDYFDDQYLSDYHDRLISLRRIVTGGFFETTSRDASPETAVEIGRQCADMTHFLRSSRSTYYSQSVWRPVKRKCQRYWPLVLVTKDKVISKVGWLSRRK